MFASFKKYNKGDGSTRIINKEIPTAEKANKYIFKGKFKESPKFMKEKEWLYNCMARDKDQLKYLKKTLLKYLSQ